MQTLKNLFPLSWKYTKDVASLVIGILIYLVVGLIAGAVIALSGLLVGWIPLLGALLVVVLSLVGGIVDLYVLAGIVIQVLVFTKVIKD